MASLALALYVVYLVLAFGGRTLMQLRRTGSTGFKGISGRPGSVEWSAGALFVAALGLGLVAPMLQLAGVLRPVAALDGLVGYTFGVLLYLADLVGTLAAQQAMGASWRIGVDESEKTELITTGPFAVVRNPIFTAMIPASLGIALLVPNVVALAAFLSLVAALELQVRLVEEPYLLRTHGERYAEYASRVGRFVPGIGRLRTRSYHGARR
jgi:protein-S-isoprenylcysteine O-methyltransferase Ste14